MSWRGFSKAMARLPHRMKQVTGHVEETIDEDYNDLEGKFNIMENLISRLVLDAKKYSDAAIALLEHQAKWSETVADVTKSLYKNGPKLSSSKSSLSLNSSYPTLNNDASPPLGNMNKSIHDSNSLNPYDIKESLLTLRRAIINDLRLVIDERILRPLGIWMDSMKNVKTKMTKRDHKLLDYDRHRGAFRKLQSNSKEERKLIRQEQIVELSYQDYSNLNELLKRELPIILELRNKLLFPILLSLYSFQKNFYQQLKKIYALDWNNNSLYRLNSNNSPSFKNTIPTSATTFNQVVEEFNQSFESVKLSIDNIALISSVKNISSLTRSTSCSSLRTGTSGYVSGLLSPGSRPSAPLAPPSYESSMKGDSLTQPISKLSVRAADSITTNQKDLPYSREETEKKLYPEVMSMPENELEPNSTEKSGYASTKVISMYTYDALEPGDLSLRPGDIIEVLERTPTRTDWWKGLCNGKIGSFPANYVKDYPISPIS